MILEKLYKMQMVLDENIHKNHNTNYQETMHQRILAFIVEVGEFANETRCFKYWSNKGPSERSVILEEYIDGIHFILSLGIALNCDYNHNFKLKNFNDSLTDQIIKVYSKASNFLNNLNLDYYYDLFEQYLSIGYNLGYTLEDVTNSYIEKNKVNFERQLSNY